MEDNHSEQNHVTNGDQCLINNLDQIDLNKDGGSKNNMDAQTLLNLENALSILMKHTVDQDLIIDQEPL